MLQNYDRMLEKKASNLLISNKLSATETATVCCVVLAENANLCVVFFFKKCLFGTKKSCCTPRTTAFFVLAPRTA